MNIKEIKELLRLIGSLDLKEVRIKDKDFELKVRTDKDQPAPIVSGSSMISQPAQGHHVATSHIESSQQTESKSEEEASEEPSSSYIEVKSPMVGTFYRSPSPDKPVYVQVGDSISKGDVICIIEAMKLFNEIESEVTGKIVKALVDDSSPVEYDQVLFLVEPLG